MRLASLTRVRSAAPIPIAIALVMVPSHAVSATTATTIAIGSDIVWVNAHVANACPGSPIHGGEATGGPDGLETWCFEGGPGDSLSDGRPGGYEFRSFDRRRMRDDNDSLYWHADTWQALSGRSMWCGGWNDRSGSWQSASGGYGDMWQQVMQLTLPGPFNAANGCSLQFRARYVLECSYDYAFLEYYSYRRGEWRAIDRYNGKSGCTVVTTLTCGGDWNNYRAERVCPGLPHGGAISYPGPVIGGATRDFPAYPYSPGQAWVVIRGDSISATPASIPELRFRWRVSTDTYNSTHDGSEDVRGFWVDDVRVKAGAYSFAENFDAVPVGGLPGPPWSFPNLEAIYDGWAIRYDIDPPFEGMIAPGPGDTGIPWSCIVDASWQWSIAPNDTLIPPPRAGTHLPGYDVMLAAPAVPLDYHDEEGGPFAHPGARIQYDAASNFDEWTCDYDAPHVRVHLPGGIGAWSGTGVWTPWTSISGVIFFGSGFGFDTADDLTASLIPGADSIQYAWRSFDAGRPGGSCWDPGLPPHTGTQKMVDNVSIGFFDAHAPDVSALTRSGRFQDTFNLHSCLHTAGVANADLGYGRYLLHDRAESLGYQIRDDDGLTPGNVRLHWSTNGFAGEAPGSPVAMNLSQPYVGDPASGGEWRGTICDTPWTPGTEVSYAIEIRDNLGNVAWEPRSAAPSASPRDFLRVRILPSAGARILLVDDNGRTVPFYHPCRQDTSFIETGDGYASVLGDLGYGYMQPGGYDRYDVQSAGSNQRINEPWGFWVADPAHPDSGQRAYDVVIYTTGAELNHATIQDTTQTFLKEFVFHGGCLLVAGDRIGDDLSEPSVARDPDFYGNLLGAEYAGNHAGGFAAPDRFPTAPSPALGPFLAAGDSLHVYSGCISPRAGMDRIRMKTAALPAWSHPSPYLVYDDTSAPFDSLAGIMNVVTATADTGLVVYLPFSVDAIVDHHRVSCDPPYSPFGDVGFGRFAGQAELLADVLAIFQSAPRTAVPPTAVATGYGSRLAISPNPVRTEATMRFSLTAPAAVTLAIYDVGGRRVGTLVDGALAAGEHAVQWKGRDHTGRATAAPGIYFARLATAHFTRTEKFLVTR